MEEVSASFRCVSIQRKKTWVIHLLVKAEEIHKILLHPFTTIFSFTIHLGFINIKNFSCVCITAKRQSSQEYALTTLKKLTALSLTSLPPTPQNQHSCLARSTTDLEVSTDGGRHNVVHD